MKNTNINIYNNKIRISMTVKYYKEVNNKLRNYQKELINSNCIKIV